MEKAIARLLWNEMEQCRAGRRTLDFQPWRLKVGHTRGSGGIDGFQSHASPISKEAWGVSNTSGIQESVSSFKTLSLGNLSAWLAVARCERDLDVSRDVVDDAVGFGDVWVAGEAHGFEAHALEAAYGVLGGEAVLDGEGEGTAEGLAHAVHGGALFGHLDEDLAGLAVGIEADGEVALVVPDGELVGEGFACDWEDLAGGDHG